MKFTPYHAKYFAHELTKRNSSASIQKLASSLMDAQVDLNPHQVDAALFAFQSPLSKGAILADEVGLGKTIEAGLVISQKWAERKRKILIIMPSNLRKQWHLELQEKFFIPSIILETASFNLQIKSANLNPFDIANNVVICSYHFARAKDMYIRLIPWDLVVIDEAHRLRNVYKPTNKIANAIKASISNVQNKLLLTATPLQNSLLELFGLISIIDDFIFGDLKSFKNQFIQSSANGAFQDLRNRIQPVCKRTLRRQVLEYINFTNRLCITQEFFPSDDEQNLYELVSAYLQRDTLYALPKSQRLLMTLILRRLLSSSTFAITGTLAALAGKLEAIAKKHTPQQESDDDIIKADYEPAEQTSDEWIDDEEDDSKVEEKSEIHYTPEDLELIEKEMQDLKRFQALAQSIKKNSKGDKLLAALSKGFSEINRLGGNKKAIIFTESRRTQIYLQQILEASEYAAKTVLFNGTNTDPQSQAIYTTWLNKYNGTDRISGSKSADMRTALVEYFTNDAIIMIATEAAAEGINLQFCSLIVNYDLPWNPQRIEQRIGRCHRYGQKFDVVVVNFLNKRNDADQRVYKILKDKFQLFDGVFGASDEVLGTIETGVDFEKRIAQIYQSCRTIEEIKRRFDELQMQLETQIDDALKSTHKKLLENFDEEVHEKLRIRLQESKEYLSKYEQWLWNVTKYYLNENAQFEENEMSFTLNKNPFPNEHIHNGPYKLAKNVKNANTYRIGHPLAQRILNECINEELAPAKLTFKYTGIPPIAAIEPLIGSSGWMIVNKLTITSFETEDHILLAALTDNGLPLDKDQCKRLFSLNATSDSIKNTMADIVKYQLKDAIIREQQTILAENNAHNAQFFSDEMEKLDKWAEDKKTSLEIQLKELDKEIKFLKTESRKIQMLDEKLKRQKYIHELETKRNNLRKSLFVEQDSFDNQKEALITEMENRIIQNATLTELLEIRWVLI
jgi:superfamily II DNA/RNA helicase